MSEREELRERIQRQMKQDSAEEISDRSIYITDLVMSTLDSWIEEQQTERGGLKEGDEVRLLTDNPDGNDQLEKGDVGTVCSIDDDSYANPPYRSYVAS